jgi:hypothetical protein
MVPSESAPQEQKCKTSLYLQPPHILYFLTLHPKHTCITVKIMQGEWLALSKDKNSKNVSSENG